MDWGHTATITVSHRASHCPKILGARLVVPPGSPWTLAAVVLSLVHSVCFKILYTDVIILHVLFCHFYNIVLYFQALPCSFSLFYLLGSIPLWICHTFLSILLFRPRDRRLGTDPSERSCSGQCHAGACVHSRGCESVFWGVSCCDSLIRASPRLWPPAGPGALLPCSPTLGTVKLKFSLFQ